MRKALIVGIDDYPNAPLSGCINDANAMSKLLRVHGDGSPNFDTKIITSDSSTIRKSTLRAALETLFNDDPDIAFFYFSGHGYVSSTGGVIVTADYESYDEGISMDDILTLANSSQAKNRVIILDCCHSGAFGTPKVSGGCTTQISEGLTVLTASKDSESAMEVGGGGVFTSLVVDALQGGASDLMGYITPGSIYAYVDQALGAWDQRPMFKTNVTRFISLRKIAPPIDPYTLRKIINYFPTPDTEYKLDPSYEFTEKVSTPEHINIFNDLQKFRSVYLVVPVGEDHMYFAAMNSKSCRLTALGYHYWRLVKEGKI